MNVSMPVRTKKPQLARLNIFSFMTAIAAFVLLSGIFGLLHYGIIDPVGDTFPSWLSITIQTTYALSGLFILLGLLFVYRNIEASGHLLLIGASIGRLTAQISFLGFDPVAYTSLLFSCILIWAAATRVIEILRRRWTIVVKA